MTCLRISPRAPDCTSYELELLEAEVLAMPPAYTVVVEHPRRRSRVPTTYSPRATLPPAQRRRVEGRRTPTRQRAAELTSDAHGQGESYHRVCTVKAAGSTAERMRAEPGRFDRRRALE